MKMTNNNVLTVLKDLKIDCEVLTHPPVATIEEAEYFWKDVSGTHCKNLFLRDKKGRRHYLVVAEKDSPVSLKALAARLGNERLSFASEKRMDKYLGLKPGSVSPFGIINDTENHVHVWLDSKLQTAERLGFHPNINTATVMIEQADFEKFMSASGNTYEYIDLEE